MREILFKAKFKNWKEKKSEDQWVEGYYEFDSDLDIHYICGFTYCTSESGLEREFFSHEIDPETLCQYTTLTDKNDAMIWENDIVCYSEYDRHTGKTTKYYGIVKYGRRAENFKLELGFNLEWLNINYFRCDICYWTENREIEVIGNIFDNPEMREKV